MAIPYIQESYSVFPYRENRSDGRNVSAGMDLVAHPELIAEIYEIQGAPELQEMLRSLNQPNGAYRTLGIEIGQADNTNWYGYLEFTWQHSETWQLTDWAVLDEGFAEYLASLPHLDGQVVPMILASLKMEWRWVSVFGNPQQPVISVYPAATTRQDWSLLVRLFAQFLLTLNNPSE